MIVHRVRARLADGRYVMQGDNRREDDGAFPSRGDFVARPIFDLGPLPATMLILLPWLMMLLCASVLGWFLWPAGSGEPRIAAALIAEAPAAPRQPSLRPLRAPRIPGVVMAGSGGFRVPAARNLGAIVAVLLTMSGLVVLRQVAPGQRVGHLGTSQIAGPADEIMFSTGTDFSVRP